MITVTTHDELVAALKGTERYIELRGKDFGWVDVRRDVYLDAYDTSKVTLRAFDTSKVTLFAYDKSKVSLVAYDTSKVTLRAYDKSKVTLDASDTSTVYLVASDTSTVSLYALDTSKVTLDAYDTSKVTLDASDTSTVSLYALDTSTVTLWAYGTSKVTEEFIGENVTINEWNGAKYVTRTKEISGDTTGTEPTTRQPVRAGASSLAGGVPNLTSVTAVMRTGEIMKVTDLGNGATMKVYADGTKFWYLDDKLHRVDGPAVESANGAKYWYLDGKRHRVDGPAIERADGSKFWYLDGKSLTEAQWRERVGGLSLPDRQPEPCANEGCEELIWETLPGAWVHVKFNEELKVWGFVLGYAGSTYNCKPLATTPRVATPRKEQ